MDNTESQEYVRSLSPTDFELYCMNILQAIAEEEKLKDFSIYHNKKLTAPDGVYQIDVYASYTALGGINKVLCECKQYNRSVKRESVELLLSRIEKLGCHKGILMTTADFQSGALLFARKHGIALVKVYDNTFEYLSHSSGMAPDSDENDPFTLAERMLPPCRAKCYFPGNTDPVEIYPTRKIGHTNQKDKEKEINERTIRCRIFDNSRYKCPPKCLPLFT